VFEGIKFNSIFNNLSSFHVCNPGLLPCVAHDQFEGVVSYDLPLFLKSLIKITMKRDHCQQLTLQLLNMRLAFFNLQGSDAAVRPPQLKASLEKLSGSASKNWCSLRIISVLISDAVDTTDEVYQAMLLLRSVTELVMAPSLAVG